MKWFFLTLGVVVLVIGILTQVRSNTLQKDWEEHNAEALRLASEREAQANVNPNKAMVLYQRPEDPTVNAIDQGEFYLALAPMAYYLTGGILTICGGVMIAVSRRRDKTDTGNDQAVV